jgi:hypothetical protein
VIVAARRKIYSFQTSFQRKWVAALPFPVAVANTAKDEKRDLEN